MRPLVLLLCGAAAATLAARAPQDKPIFRTGVELVSIDVTVVDKDGNQVTGLTARDFVVTLEGHDRQVRTLDYLEFGGGKVSDAAPARETSNTSPGANPRTRGGRVILLLVDDLSFKPGSGMPLTAAMRRMLATLDPDDLVGMVTTSGLGPAVNPTRDRAAVASALQSRQTIGRYDDSTAPMYIGIQEAVEIERGIPADTGRRVAARECPLLNQPIDSCQAMVESQGRMLARNSVHRAAMQIAACQHAIQALRGAPAPKIVIAVSTGIATGADAGALQRQLDPITRAAADAGVQFYGLTEVADGAEAIDLTPERARTRRDESLFLNAGVQTLAAAAGGEAFLVVGTADRFIKRIEAETSGIYRLGVEVPPRPDRPRFLDARVTVRRPGTTVRTHRRAVATDVAAEAVPIEDSLRMTLAQGGAAYGVPVAVATARRRDPAGPSLQLGVTVQVPSTVPGPITVMFALVNEAGRILQAGRKTVAGPAPDDDYRLAIPVPLPPGPAILRVAVADGRGNIGSIEHAVAGALTRIGAFAVSDLLTVWTGPDRTPRFLALSGLPSGAAMLGASLELYSTGDAGVPAPDLIVRFALVGAGSGTPLLTRDVTPAINGTTMSAATEMPVDRLGAGTYTLRATIVEAAREIGSVSTPIRKIGLSTAAAK